MLLGNHGVLAWGADLEQEYLRLDLVEHLANIALHAERAGGLRPLPESALAPLLAARAKAGLGMAASATTATPGRKTVVACAPAPGADVDVIAPGRKPDAGELARIIREELSRALSK